MSVGVIFRILFLSFYAIYVLSYFLLARMSAMGGTLFAQALAGKEVKTALKLSGRTVGFFEVAINAVIGIAINAVVYVGAAFLPRLAIGT